MWDTTSFNGADDWPLDGSQPLYLSTGDRCVPPLYYGRKHYWEFATGVSCLTKYETGLATASTATTSSAGRTTHSRRPWTTVATSETAPSSQRCLSRSRTS